MSVQEIAAIDVHGHFGVARGQLSEFHGKFMSAGAEAVAERARKSNIRLTVVSPIKALSPKGKTDAVAGNREAAEMVSQIEGLLQWVVVDPHKDETYRQAEQMLTQPKCVGIKIHPELHEYDIEREGRKIFEFAARHGAIIQSHTGEANCMPEDFIAFANDFPEARLILAHLGHAHDNELTHQVRAIQASKHGNVFVDTSSAKNIIPGLLEWAVDEIGAERLLFGTDTPLYVVPMQRARIDGAQISDHQKQLILHDNAAALLGSKAL